MATVLAISSQVSRGSVGLSVIMPTLQALGHRVIAFPTIMLSNHPGHGAIAGQRIEPQFLAKMRDVMAGHGWLSDVDAVLSGYLPSSEHVEFVAETVRIVRRARSDCRFICDPVIGDDPKGLYIDGSAAEKIRDLLLPLADISTPNSFELAWLSGRTALTQSDAISAARSLNVPHVIATSIATGADRMATVSVDGEGAYACEVAVRNKVAKGTGDMVSALAAAGWSLGRIAAALDAAIAANEGSDEIDLAADDRSWLAARPMHSEKIDAER